MDAAATDAKQRPGFPTSTRDACATPDSDLGPLTSDRLSHGRGGGVGRGLGVARGLGVGVGLAVGVGLPEAVAVAVAVGVMTVAVAVAVAVGVGVGGGVGVPHVPSR